jgi:hypothetical protein
MIGYAVAGWFGVGILIGGFCAFIANEKGRGGGEWFFLGLVGGIFALIAIAAVPALEKKEPEPDGETSQVIDPHSGEDDPAVAVTVFIVAVFVAGAFAYVWAVS